MRVLGQNINAGAEMKTKKNKPSELRVKRGKRKMLSLKRNNLANDDWYAGAAVKFAISRARHPNGSHPDGRGGDDGAR